MQGAPPLIDRNWSVEEYGIKHQLLCVAIRCTDHENRGHVIPPSNPPVWVVGCFRPEEIRGTGGESPHL
jgi:hypothetical protein